jgi:hypothetical protein
MDKPAGVAQRVTRPDGTVVVQVGTMLCSMITDLLQESSKQMKTHAEMDKL